MLTNVHTTVGTATLIGVTALTGSLTAGITTSIFSHWFLDLFGERKYDKVFHYEFLFHILFLGLGLSLNAFWWFVGGIITGNLFDIIDKKGYLSMYDLKRFPYTFYFHKFKVKWEMTKNQTKDLTVLNTLIIVVILFSSLMTLILES